MMKSSLTISFLILLMGLTIIHGVCWPIQHAYKKVLERLEACIEISSLNVLPFEFKNDLVKQLNAFPSKYRNIYIGHDESLSDDVHDGAVTALTRTIETIFEEYKKRPNANLECLNTIQTVDPIGFIIYSTENDGKKSTAVSFASAILDFHSTLVQRRLLLNSMRNISYIEPFETNLDEKLHSIPEDVLEEVALEDSPLSYLGIHYFLDIANEQFQTQNMYCEMNYYLIMEKLRPYVSKEIDDIQILFGGLTSFKSINDVQLHWICTYYKADTQQLYVYDSKCEKHLTKSQQEIIKHLYPNRQGKIIYVKSKNIHTDDTACELFAIFYATTLLLGQKPEDIDVKMNNVYGDPGLYMRLHVLKMFANRKLVLFN